MYQTYFEGSMRKTEILRCFILSNWGGGGGGGDKNSVILSNTYMTSCGVHVFIESKSWKLCAWIWSVAHFSARGQDIEEKKNNSNYN